MSKTKEEKEKKEEISIKEKINKEYNSNICVSINDIKDKPRKFVHTTFGLDSILGGGIVEGTTTVLGGMPKVGKTTTALQIARNAQAQYKKELYYFKAEARLQPEFLDTLPGLDPSLTNIIQSNKDKILMGEDFLNIATNIILQCPCSVVIIDSLPALVSQTEFAADMTNLQRAELAKMLSKFFRKTSNAISINDIILILITRLSCSVDGSNVTYMLGGNSFRFQADFIISMKKGDKIKCGEDIVGHWIAYKTDAALTAPEQKANVPLIYGHALDEAFEMSYLGQALGIIDKNGSWYEVDTKSLGMDEDKMKFHGEIELWNSIKENKQLYDALYKHISGVYKK